MGHHLRRGRVIIMLGAAAVLLFSGSATALPGAPGVGAGKCGNGAIDKGEQCDFGSLNGATCQSLGHDGGTLSCGANCQFDESECIPAECGNGLHGPTEECELDSPPARCTDLQAGYGSASCGEDCTYETSTCIDEPRYAKDCINEFFCECDPGDVLITGGASCTVFGADASYCEQSPQAEPCRVLKFSNPTCANGPCTGWQASCGGSGSSSGQHIEPFTIILYCLRQ